MVTTKSIGVNPKKFRERFNSFSKEIESPFSIGDIEAKKGKVQDVAMIMLNDNIAINLSINKKDGTVRDLVMFSQGDGSQKSGYDILLVIGTLVSVTNPKLNEDGRADVLRGLGLNKGLPTDKVVYIEGNIRYTLSSTAGIGIMFTAGNKDDD
ncbi:hypothetical protein J22TS1_43500 [Siminovitchia terrae]|uniref:hypothetical protein n=1 Tax=Siminovitchia terrae TaxID=1914933 RepID=UPI001B12C75F|nr:hypothetical protein [Siminovitchia terrae]GIN93299.1 hypothetical protein J22TS1_43500 [Siminovitchia terrae]